MRAAYRVILRSGGGPAAQRGRSDVTNLEVIVFDVNETLSDLTPLAQWFTDIGAPEWLARLWFASLLRDGFARTATGSSERFATIAAGVLPGMLTGVPINRSTADAVEHVMAGLAALRVHPDVPEGVRALKSQGLRLVTLTNGSTDMTERLLAEAGIHEQFDLLLSVEQAGVWKPARPAYEYAAHTCGVAAEAMMLDAVHPWDIDGAARAGMSTAWLNREGHPLPRLLSRP